MESAKLNNQMEIGCTLKTLATWSKLILARNKNPIMQKEKIKLTKEGGIKKRTTKKSQT
ncbi:hypothetical protein RUM43_008702, partial [Polyplax serrata]